MALNVTTYPPAATEPENHGVPPRTAQKLSVFVVTADDALWPQVGAVFGEDFMAKQLDSIEELIELTPADQASVVLWDARGQSDVAAGLARIQKHSARYAIVALDEASTATAWDILISHRRVVAMAALPLDGAELAAALKVAREDVMTRLAVPLGAHPVRGSVRAGTVGDGTVSSGMVGPGVAGWTSRLRRPKWLAAAGVGGLLVACGLYLLLRHRPATVVPSALSPPAVIVAEDSADALMDQARAAMAERHYIDPMQGSALSIYREVLSQDPANGEARQGLARVAEILISRVQSALDQRKFDLALQSLETARSIDPEDGRLKALDARVAALRDELGPAQIQAAISAQNFDRAAQLIEVAAKGKSVDAAKLGALREELRRRREEVNLARLRAHAAGASLPAAHEINASTPAPDRSDRLRFLDLARVRLAKGSVIEPENDSALYYVNQLRAVDPQNAGLGPIQTAIQEQILERVRTALDANELSKAEQLLALAGGLGASSERSALNVRLAQAKAAVPAPGSAGAPAAPAEVSEASLIRANKLRLDYPQQAVARGLEGWVELSYNVAPDGQVTQLKVYKSSSPGVFDAAALRALAKLRYEPATQNGQATTVSTKIRIVFRLPK